MDSGHLLFAVFRFQILLCFAQKHTVIIEGLAGGLLAQYQGSANINMGRGAIVIGLASVIIGEVIFGARFNFAYQLGSIVAGSVIYQIVIAFVLQLGLSTEDLKLFSAVTVALALSVPALQKKFLKSKFTPVPAGKE